MNLVRVLRRPPILDAILAVLFTAAVVGITTRLNTTEGDFRKLDAAGYAAMIVGCGVLIWRRRVPRIVLAVTVVAICVYGARNYTGGPIYIADAIRDVHRGGHQ